MNKNHYVVYFEKGIAISKTSKEWVRDNQSYFPKYSFLNSDNEPTSITIDLYLVDKLSYTLISDKEKFVCFKLTNK